MPEPNVRAATGFNAISPGRYGRTRGEPGVIAGEIIGVGLAQIKARKNRAGLAEATRRAFGVELPRAPRCAEGRGLAFVWSGPERWLALAPEAPDKGMEALLGEPFARLAAIIDESHGRVLLRAHGARIRDALGKGLSVDLDPRAFRPGHAAITTVAQIGVLLWQRDERPTYEFALPRSLAQSYWHWLGEATAEWGLEWRPPRNYA